MGEEFILVRLAILWGLAVGAWAAALGIIVFFIGVIISFFNDK